MSISAVRPNLSLLIFLSAVAVLPVNLFVPSLPQIARDFDASYALVNMAIAGYAVVTAATHFVAGALSDRFGRRPVALVALGIFTLASVGCVVAPDIAVFLAFRMLQGVVIAAYAVSLATIRDTSTEREAAKRIGRVSSAWAFAPMVGPTIGGLLETYAGWRASFVCFAVLGVVGFGIAMVYFGETNAQRTKSVFRWDNYLSLLRWDRFWGYALCMAFSIGTLYCFLGGAPLVAESLNATSAAGLGVYMGVVPAAFILGSSLAGRYGARHAPHVFMVGGRLLTIVGLTVGLALYLGGIEHMLAFFGPCAFIGLGNGLTMPAANAGVLSLKSELAGTASGLANSVTVIGAAAIAALSGAMLTASNAQWALFSVMITASIIAFLSATTVAILDGRTNAS